MYLTTAKQSECFQLHPRVKRAVEIREVSSKIVATWVNKELRPSSFPLSSVAQVGGNTVKPCKVYASTLCPDKPSVRPVIARAHVHMNTVRSCIAPQKNRSRFRVIRYLLRVLKREELKENRKTASDRRFSPRSIAMNANIRLFGIAGERASA
jgi:hypothetical protein